jgi:hypothetical protein
MTVVVSIIAVGLAIFFAALAWRLAQQERLRSAARVAALGDAIDDATVTGPIETVGVQHGFLTPQHPNSTRSGMIKLAVGFAGAVVLIIAVATMSTNQERRTPASGSGPAAAAKDSSLELMSMRHAREGDTLTVTGLVRNGGTSPADRVIAVVFTFDRNGSFVTSGRAPLEFVSLAPGDESPFRVSVPDVGDVGRYRVSFRTEAGVVRHVDRRQALVARRAE